MMAEIAIKKDEWANPGALGLAAFGLNTILLQIHNLGLIGSTMPLVFGFFWGGVAQIIAGIIDGRRGEMFGMTAFISYGAFWIGLGFSFLLQWTGLVPMDKPGYAWLFICWAVFTGFMAVGTFKINAVLVFVFVSLVVLFLLLAAVFFGTIPAWVAGAEGLFCGAAAVYGAAAVIINGKYGRDVLPIGLFAT